MPFVRKRGIILFLVLLVALAGWEIFCALPPREPVYEGKPLSYWLKGYDPIEGSEPGRQQTDEAVRQIGTNAIPLLLRMLREQDSPLKLKLLALARRQHVVKINYVEASRRNIQAELTFEQLGPTAAGAVPELIKICEIELDQPPGQNSIFRERILIEALGSIGPRARTAVPLIVKALEFDSYPVHPIAALGEIHAKPEIAVPALMKCLKKSVDSSLRLEAAVELGRFGKDAKPAVPMLIELWKETDPALKTAAADALKQIDPETAAKFPVPSREIVN